MSDEGDGAGGVDGVRATDGVAPIGIDVVGEGVASIAEDSVGDGLPNSPAEDDAPVTDWLGVDAGPHEHRSSTPATETAPKMVRMRMFEPQARGSTWDSPLERNLRKRFYVHELAP